jgi:hypothetical protein
MRKSTSITRLDDGFGRKKTPRFRTQDDSLNIEVVICMILVIYLIVVFSVEQNIILVSKGKSFNRT